MKLSISIMMHPTRKKNIPYLKGKLGDIPIAMDNKNEIWDTCSRAWKLYDKNADYHCVIQDDGIIGNDFYNRAIKEIEAHPNHAFSFYYGNRKEHREVARQGITKGGVKTDWISWGVAICLPTKHIESMIDFCNKLPDGYKKHDDTMIAKYLQSIKMPVWYPLPSLVDHRTENTLIDENGAVGRKAYKFIGE